MGWFGNRNRETNEAEIGKQSGESTSELPDSSEGKEKLDSGERDNCKAFRDSLKVEPWSDGKEKLDTSNKSNETDNTEDGGERGNFERSSDGGRTDYER